MKNLLLSFVFWFSLALASNAIITGVGCTTSKSRQVVMVKTLKSVETAVAAASKAMESEMAAGRVPHDIIVKALEASNRFERAYTAAVLAAKSTDKPSPENVTAAAAEFIALVSTFTKP